MQLIVIVYMTTCLYDLYQYYFMNHYTEISSEVLQGDYIYPLLFLLFINIIMIFLQF